VAEARAGPQSKQANDDDPDEYEQLVAGVLRDEGWSASVTASVHDLDFDVIAERAGERPGGQAKMFLRRESPGERRSRHADVRRGRLL